MKKIILLAGILILPIAATSCESMGPAKCTSDVIDAGSSVQPAENIAPNQEVKKPKAFKKCLMCHKIDKSGFAPKVVDMNLEKFDNATGGKLKKMPKQKLSDAEKRDIKEYIQFLQKSR